MKIFFLFISLFLVLVRLENNNLKDEFNGPDVIFIENFNDGGDRWVSSKEDKYTGNFKVREANDPIKIVGEKGLVVENEAKHHGISVRLPTIDNKDKDLVIQYEVRLMNGLQCGGAYIKLLTEESLPSDLGEFKDSTPFSIMFGPDRCGTNDIVHFIFRHQNPVSKKWEEKHCNKTSTIKTDTLTHLYTLHVTPDNKYEILIDMESVASGSLLENFNPPVNPPEMIDDPNDKKPSDWVDDEQIPDATATKPDDWDEDAPATIVDPDATKPEGWLDDAPLKIPDPSAVKPDDWDDDLDGEYEAPEIANPQCEEFGCGEWKPPTIANPEYKGKWKPPMIPNPAFIGIWKPKQIKNPDFFEEKNPYIFAPIGALGIEIWTMQGGIMFDNFFIGYDKDTAYSFAKKTWKPKYDEEKRIQELNAPKDSMMESGLRQLNNIIEAGMVYAKDQRNLPVIVGSLIAGILVPVLMCFCLSGGKKKTGKQNNKKQEEEDGEETDKVEDKKETKKETPTKKRKGKKN